MTRLSITALRLAKVLGTSASLAILATQPVSAETLQEALLKAYQSNPTLTGARAAQRATDENVPIQKAAGRPSARSEERRVGKECRL